LSLLTLLFLREFGFPLAAFKLFQHRFLPVNDSTDGRTDKEQTR